MISVDKRVQERPRTALSTQTGPISTRHLKYQTGTRASLSRHVLHHTTIPYNSIQSNIIQYNQDNVKAQGGRKDKTIIQYKTFRVPNGDEDKSVQTCMASCFNTRRSHKNSIPYNTMQYRQGQCRGSSQWQAWRYRWLLFVSLCCFTDTTRPTIEAACKRGTWNTYYRVTVLSSPLLAQRSHG